MRVGLNTHGVGLFVTAYNQLVIDKQLPICCAPVFVRSFVTLRLIYVRYR